MRRRAVGLEASGVLPKTPQSSLAVRPVTPSLIDPGPMISTASSFEPCLRMCVVREKLVYSAVLRGRAEHLAHSPRKEVSCEATGGTERRLCDRGPRTQASNAVFLERIHRRQIWNGHDVEGHWLDG